jgi:hypothetical protein
MTATIGVAENLIMLAEILHQSGLRWIILL